MDTVKQRTLGVNLTLVLIFLASLIVVKTGLYETAYHTLDYFAAFLGNIALYIVIFFVAEGNRSESEGDELWIRIQNLTMAMGFAVLTIELAFATVIVWPMQTVLACITAILALMTAFVTYGIAYCSFEEETVEEVPLVGLMLS